VETIGLSKGGREPRSLFTGRGARSADSAVLPRPAAETTNKGKTRMSKYTLITTLFTCALCALGTLPGHAQDLDSLRPVVVKTVPESGIKDVAPGTFEIRVTFSKEMMDGSWSWSTAWENSTPDSIGKPKYDTDHKTCVMKVKLEPGKTYGFWLNSDRFKNFKDKQGRPSVPYLLAFKTKEQ
jgi:hypothetical protein